MTAAELRARAEAALAEAGRFEDAVVDGVPRARRAPGRARPAGRRTRRHRARGRGHPRRGVPRPSRDRVAGQRARSSTRCCTATGRPPASRPRRCSRSTTTWWCGDERRPGCGAATGHRGRRRHRSTLLIGLALVAAVAVRWCSATAPRPRSRWTPTTPARTAPARWPGCSRTRASTSRWPATPTRWTRSTSTARRPWSSSLPYNLGASTIERLLDHTADAHTGRGRRRPRRRRGVRRRRAAASQIDLGDGPPAGLRRPRSYDGLTLEVDSATVYAGRRAASTAGAARWSPSREDGLVLFGADQALTNDQVLRADNAAVALRLLGQDDRLVWYVPSLDDLVGDDGVSLQQPAPPLGPPGAGARGHRDGRGDLSGAAAGWARWPPSRCRSWCAPSRPPAASAGCTGARATAATPPPRCDGARGRRCAERLRLGSTAAGRRGRPRGGPPHRPAARRGGRAARPGRHRTVHRPRPDHPGQAAGRARQRGTPYMTETPQTAGRRPRSRPRAARRGARRGRQGRGRARTPRSPGCSSPCCAAATC